MYIPVATSTGEAPTAWRYETGDAALISADGYLRLLGREGNALNVAGRRLGTREIEAAIIGIDGIAEAAVVGVDGPRSDTALYAYVTAKRDAGSAGPLRERVRTAVAAAIGRFATPDVVVFTPDLPKTRSGKVLRRHLRQIASGERVSDTEPLRNPEIVGELESIVNGVSE